MGSLIPIHIKLGIMASIAILVGLGAYWLYDRVWTAGYSQKTLEIEADSAKWHAANAAALIKKGEKHDADQTTITNLSADVKRLRFVKSRACLIEPTPTPPTGGNGTSRPLPNSVDEAYRKFESGAGALILRCDQLNIDAIRANR